MNLFYNPTLKETDAFFTFDKEESRHISKVLRKNIGDFVQITDGKGHFYDAEITASDSKKCSVKILKMSIQPPLPYYLHLAVAPTKLNERFEWFLEKATEIGVSEITPIICDHSERKVIKWDRYEKIVISAMKQSLKAHLPKLNEAITFKEFVEQAKTSEKLKFIAHCEETSKESLKRSLQKNKGSIIMIGPEGDFSSEEIKLAIHSKYKPVGLGESRLRTETAAIVACHSVAFFNE